MCAWDTNIYVFICFQNLRNKSEPYNMQSSCNGTKPEGMASQFMQRCDGVMYKHRHESKCLALVAHNRTQNRRVRTCVAHEKGGLLRLRSVTATKAT